MKITFIKRNHMLFKAGLMLSLLFLCLRGEAQIATINITNINSTGMDKTPFLFGISFDARTSLTANGGLGQIGYYTQKLIQSNTDG